MLTLRWLKKIGGVAEAEKRNIAKANLFYDTLDSLPLFKGTVKKEDRSKMNACFVAENKDLEKEFSQLCKENEMIGLKGHRTVGGFRASMYNALPIESVKALTDLIKYFAQKKG
jgi:phosphoserine aminotransferase